MKLVAHKLPRSLAAMGCVPSRRAYKAMPEEVKEPECQPQNEVAAPPPYQVDTPAPADPELAALTAKVIALHLRGVMLKELRAGISECVDAAITYTVAVEALIAYCLRRGIDYSPYVDSLRQPSA